jgi:hypothetical protein
MIDEIGQNLSDRYFSGSMEVRPNIAFVDRLRSTIQPKRLGGLKRMGILKHAERLFLRAP